MFPALVSKRSIVNLITPVLPYVSNAYLKTNEYTQLMALVFPKIGTNESMWETTEERILTRP
jgi:hypothetical protein